MQDVDDLLIRAYRINPTVEKTLKFKMIVVERILSCPKSDSKQKRGRENLRILKQLHQINLQNSQLLRLMWLGGKKQLKFLFLPIEKTGRKLKERKKLSTKGAG